MFQYTRLIIGLGKTGYSVAQYWANQGLLFRVIDNRPNPPLLKKFRQAFPNIPIHTGSIHSQWMQESQEIILSPGIDPKQLGLLYDTLKEKIYSDIDLFDRVAKAPILAITGSNGKSTVTLLTEHLLKAAGYVVETGGNLGRPVLDLLRSPTPDFYVIELSSFQLYNTQRIKTACSVFLNLAPDHLDRHGTLEDYQKAKQKIYRHCKVAIWNREDPTTYPIYPVSQTIDFGLQRSAIDSFYLHQTEKNTYLMQGDTALINSKLLKIQGIHNYLNILAACAAIQSVHSHITSLIPSLIDYKGLPHRLEYIYTEKQITWLNDSKATNVHATQAALASFNTKQSKTVILIAGGIAKKNDNFMALKPLFLKNVKLLILIGKEISLFKSYFLGIVPIVISTSLEEATRQASNYAVSGDTILFSPACASQDMFEDYVARGECFKKSVHLLYSSEKNL